MRNLLNRQGRSSISWHWLCRPILWSCVLRCHLRCCVLRRCHLRSKPRLHAGLWCRLNLLLSWIQRNDLLRNVYPSSPLTIENARVRWNSRLVRVGRLSHLILLQLNSVWIADLAWCGLHRQSLSWCCLVWPSLVRDRLHGRSVVR